MYVKLYYQKIVILVQHYKLREEEGSQLFRNTIPFDTCPAVGAVVETARPLRATTSNRT